MACDGKTLAKTILILMNAIFFLVLCMAPLTALCSTLSKYNSADNTNVNVILVISSGDGKIIPNNLTVSIYDLNGSLILSWALNDTGRLDANLKKGLYTVIVKADNNIVSSHRIHIEESKTITINMQSYALEATCIDQEEKYVRGAVVLLYGLAGFSTEGGAHEEWQLVNLARTDENGTALFHGVWGGIYRITVKSGKTIGENTLEVYEPKHITIKCDRASLKINVVTSAPIEYPLSNASVLLQDSAGHLLFKGYTDDYGSIEFENLYIGNYTIFVDWMDAQIFSGVVNTRSARELRIRTSVFKVSLHVKGPLGESLPRSKIFISKIISRRTVSVGEIEADDNGFITFFLPFGTYELTCVSGIYYGKITINLSDNYGGAIQCNVHSNVWALIFLLSSPLLILSLVIERNKLRKPLEYRRYQNMLSRLESMYSSGLVEYKIYRKLKEEYETKLIELGGRRRR